MSRNRSTNQQFREQVLRATTNSSTSKTAWTFTRTKRFSYNQSNCPELAYLRNNTTLSQRSPSIGHQKRKVFTEASQAPSSWIYQPAPIEHKKAAGLALGRQQVISYSYINPDPIKNPGPGKYKDLVQRRRGVSMRPRTANDRNYFIADQERAMVPGPGEYPNKVSKIVGKNYLSRFKTAMGGSTLLNKSPRFVRTDYKVPSSWKYNRDKYLVMSKAGRGCAIGRHDRRAFTDQAAKISVAPGPGNYNIPADFSHY